ncbi:hypothetical protein [Chitinophaga caseinilytica]|uniref:hypothetical protein n=1 Tax=Chitinophaga caseinilytica TaxID=2267521 RepID=UPI003C2C9DCF
MPITHRLIPPRMVIFARDIQNITGRSERTARLLLQRIRKAYGKKAGQFVSVEEFCRFTALPVKEVRSYLEH